LASKAANAARECAKLEIECVHLEKASSKTCPHSLSVLCGLKWVLIVIKMVRKRQVEGYVTGQPARCPMRHEAMRCDRRKHGREVRKAGGKAREVTRMDSAEKSFRAAFHCHFTRSPFDVPANDTVRRDG
jgi:hypothetical protein